MTAVGVPFEWLDAVDVARRWPAVARSIRERAAIFQADAGIADPERGQRGPPAPGARRPGATLLERTHA